MALMADYTRNKALYLRRYFDGKTYLHCYQIESNGQVESKGIFDAFISSDVSGNGDMQVSPDGKWLAVMNRIDGSGLSADAIELRLYRIGEDRSQVSLVDTVHLNADMGENFDFSPESKYIYTGIRKNNQWGIYRIKMSDHSMQLVTAVTPSSVRRGKNQKMYYGIDGSSQLYPYLSQASACEKIDAPTKHK